MIIYLQQHIPLILGLIALAVSLFELLRSGQKILKIGLNGWINIIMTLLSKYIRPTNASHLLISPPPIAQKNIEALKSIGFRRLGEIQIKYPFQPPLTGWIFAHLERPQIQAGVAWKRIEFSTYFQDNILLVTDFPNGEHIEMPNYQSHTITTTVADAYRHHLEQITKFSLKYGQPHPLRNMTDYLHWELVGRKNYGVRKLQRWVWANIVRLIAFIYGCLVLILVPIFFDPQNIPVISHAGLFYSQEAVVYLVILLILPAIVASRYANRRAVQQTHKDSRMISKQQK
jgi:hypothetical protein